LKDKTASATKQSEKQVAEEGIFSPVNISQKSRCPWIDYSIAALQHCKQQKHRHALFVGGQAVQDLDKERNSDILDVTSSPITHPIFNG